MDICAWETGHGAEWAGRSSHGGCGAKAELYEQFAGVGQALASPKRLELLDLLAQGERSVEVSHASRAGPDSCSRT